MLEQNKKSYYGYKLVGFFLFFSNNMKEIISVDICNKSMKWLLVRQGVRVIANAKINHFSTKYKQQKQPSVAWHTSSQITPSSDTHSQQYDGHTKYKPVTYFLKRNIWTASFNIFIWERCKTTWAFVMLFLWDGASHLFSQVVTEI